MVRRVVASKGRRGGLPCTRSDGSAPCRRKCWCRARSHKASAAHRRANGCQMGVFTDGKGRDSKQRRRELDTTRSNCATEEKAARVSFKPLQRPSDLRDRLMHGLHPESCPTSRWVCADGRVLSWRVVNPHTHAPPNDQRATADLLWHYTMSKAVRWHTHSDTRTHALAQKNTRAPSAGLL